MKRAICLIFLMLFLTSCVNVKTDKQNKTKNMYENIRRPAVAGQYYPADAAQLQAKIEKFLNAATSTKPNGAIKAIMVPHAGYDFSGGVAASAYKLLAGKKFDNIIIMCNSHNNYFQGAAIDSSDAWQTPLGIIELNQELAGKIVNASDKIRYNNNVHAPEQTLEVHLPFLQVVLKEKFKIVPILFGNTDDNDYIEVARALAENLGENDLVIASSDMSHYPEYKDANRIDNGTLKVIETGNIQKLEDYMINIEKEKVKNEQTILCGVDGVKTVMALAEKLKWNNIEILKYENSGDVLIGDHTSVVGYGAVAFSKVSVSEEAGKTETAKVEFTSEEKEILINIARDTVENYIKNNKIPEFTVKDEKLKRKSGAFVTLEKDGKLRGCIGQIIPTEAPLWQVVRDMAIEAATEDPRFSPIKLAELPNIVYEISVLSAPEKIDSWQNIELGKHGVIISKGNRSGVFLPQVATETGWGKEEFLSYLCSEKAGLAPDAYKNDPGAEIFVFTAEIIK